jgi:hypothetical protein
VPRRVQQRLRTDSTLERRSSRCSGMRREQPLRLRLLVQTIACEASIASSGCATEQCRDERGVTAARAHEGGFQNLQLPSAGG